MFSHFMFWDGNYANRRDIIALSSDMRGGAGGGEKITYKGRKSSPTYLVASDKFVTLFAGYHGQARMLFH